jgi:hypothetical protein
MPLTGKHGIECRTGPTAGAHNVIATFTNTLTSVASVSATATTSTGTTTLNPAPTGNIILDSNNNPTNQYSINLTGVPDASHVFITLHGVVDARGDSGDVTIPMDVLFGDVNGNGRVEGNDVSGIQSKVRSQVNNVTCRYDVNTNGAIEGNDVSLTQSSIRTFLP